MKLIFATILIIQNILVKVIIMMLRLPMLIANLEFTPPKTV